jgi:4-hydroxy-2-oxoglutarate aldolase
LFDSLTPSASFTVLGGATDYLLGGLSVGGKGAITGMANVAPRACAKAFQLFQAGKTTEALEIAGEVSKAEWGMGKGGIMGTKVG